MDFLNDQAASPDENGTSVGWIWEDRLAAFKVYGVAEDPEFFGDITIDIRRMQVSLSAPVGSPQATGKVIYSRSGGAPALYFKPARVPRPEEDRIVFLDFAYHCRKVYRNRFTLTIRGTRSRSDAAFAAASPPTLLSESIPAHNGRPFAPDCADLEVTVTVPDTPVRQGDLATVAVVVTNLGPGAKALPVIRIPRLRVRSLQTTQGNSYQGFWADSHIEYYPGHLEPGLSATLTLMVHALESGSKRVAASVWDTTSDCNPDNDRDEAEFEVLPDVPDLTAQWTRQQLTLSGAWPNLQLRVRGSLVVSNNTQWDAAPSRVALFLSEGARPGRESRFLGFREVPSLPAGASTTLVIARDLTMHDPRWNPRLMALLDSSNSIYELHETNNVVVSRPPR